MIEKVTQGNLRTVEFSLPMGINEETIPRKMRIRRKRRMPNIEVTSRQLLSEGSLGRQLNVLARTEPMITKGY